MAGALLEKKLRLSLAYPIVSDSYRHSFPMELVCDPNGEADLFLTVFKAKVPMFDLWFDLTYSTFDGVTGSFYPDWSEWTFGDLKEAKDVLHSYLDSIDVLRVFLRTTCGYSSGRRPWTGAACSPRSVVSHVQADRSTGRLAHWQGGGIPESFEEHSLHLVLLRPVGREIPAGPEAYRPSAGVESTGGHRLPGPAVRDKPQGAGLRQIGFPGFESRGEEITVPASHCPRFTPAPTSPITLKGRQVMSNNKISGIHAIGVEVPEDMSLKELMEQLLNDTEVELEKDLDGETRKPEPQSEADKWQRYADMLGDLFDVAHQIGYDAYMQGDLKITRKVLQVESDVVDLAGIVTMEKSRAVK